MIALAVVAFLCVAVPVGLGVVVSRRRWGLPGGGPAAWGRAGAARIGAIPATVAILGLGMLATVALCLPVGYLAKSLQHPVDEPTLAWVGHRVHASPLRTLNVKLTIMGNNGIVQVVCLLAGVLLAVHWRRRFWVPLVLIVAAFYLERYGQRFLAHTVDRGHPPVGLGTYPSGGVARLIMIYGLLLVLVLYLLPTLSRGWRVGLYTGLGAAGAVEAFTRVYLSKHWLTDALGGLVFGYLGLAVLTAATAALVGPAGPGGPARTGGPARRSAPTALGVG